MRKTHRFLKGMFIVIFANLFVTAIMSAISFSYLCTYSSPLKLRFPHIITILFLITIASVIGLAIYTAVKTQTLGITRIKRQYKFLQFASVLCAIMMFIFFIYECIITITKADLQIYFFFRASKWILTIPVCIYFIFQALPKKIHKSTINISRWAKIGSSVCAIAWSLFGVMTVYFSGLNFADISKITVSIAYIAIAAFFVFEGEFEFVKPSHRAYIISAFACAALTLSFPLGISFAKITGKISEYAAYSQPELLLIMAIGVYALSKMLALLSTMHTVIDNSSTSAHSSKFNRVHVTREENPAPATQSDGENQ